jgi:WD40 repeat protein
MGNEAATGGRHPQRRLLWLVAVACAAPSCCSEGKLKVAEKRVREAERRVRAAEERAIDAEDRSVMTEAELLLATDPSAGVASLRRLSDRADPVAAWTLLAAARRRGTARVLSVPGMVSMASSPDGRVIATGARDGRIQLWSTTTRMPLGQPLLGHRKLIDAVAISPDGKLLASVASNNATTSPGEISRPAPHPDLRFWSVPGGLPVGPPLELADHVYQLAFSPDGATLATGGSEVRLWELRTRRVRCRLPDMPGCMTIDVVLFSPDGKTLATSCTGDEYNTEEVRLWEASSCRSLGGTLRGHGRGPRALAFSPDGKKLAAGAYPSEEVLLWDVQRRRRIAAFGATRSEIASLAFSPDGSLLAGGDEGGRIRLWRIEMNEVAAELEGHEHDDVFAAAFSADGRTLLSASHDGTVRVWDLPRDLAPGRQLASTPATIHSLAVAPDGSSVAAVELLAGEARTFLWPAARGAKPLVAHDPPSRFGCTPAFSPDGKILATSAAAKPAVLLWEAASLRPLRVLGPTSGVVGAVAFTSDGHRLASASKDGTVGMWEVASGRPLGPPLAGSPGDHPSAALSPDGTLLAATGGDDGVVRLWDLRAPARGAKELRSAESVRALAFTTDGRSLITGAERGKLKLWDPRTGLPRRTSSLGIDVSFSQLSLSRDGRRLVTATYNRGPGFWDPVTLRRLGVSIDSAHLIGAALSADGRWLALSRRTATDAEHEVRLWDLHALRISEIRAAARELGSVEDR